MLLGGILHSIVKRITSICGRSYLQIMKSFRTADGKPQRHSATIASRSVGGIPSPTPTQLHILKALNVPKLA